MPNGIALRTEEVPQQVATYGGAFGTGIVLGWVANSRPTWAVGLTLTAAAGGAIGAMMTRGFASEMLEGMGAAAMGSLGSSLPGLLGGAERRVSQVNGRPAPKLLGAPTNVVGNAIARSAKVGLEI